MSIPCKGEELRETIQKLLKTFDGACVYDEKTMITKATYGYCGMYQDCMRNGKKPIKNKNVFAA